MERVDRLQKAFEYLRYKGIANTQIDVANKMGRQRTNVSSAFNGKERYLTDSFLKEFCDTFSVFSADWLLTGEGSMLVDEVNKEAPVVANEKTKGAVPYYGDLPVSAGQQDLATIAVNDVGISKYVVNDMLNHTDPALRVTELYIKKDFRVINEANVKVLDYVVN